jgi:hypothetical protein
MSSFATAGPSIFDALRVMEAGIPGGSRARIRVSTPLSKDGKDDGGDDSNPSGGGGGGSR